MWSGGKDSCFASYKASKEGIKVECLLNFVSKDTPFSHHLNKKLVFLQSFAVGIPMIQKQILKDYEEAFKEAFSTLKEKGVESGVFGDIYLQEHKDWIERVCEEVGILPIFPLWMRSTGEVFKEFTQHGFKAVIVCAKANIIPRSWLGRVLDEGLLRDLLREGVDPCGERGEFHSFVIDGPIFKYPINLQGREVHFKGGYWCLKLEI